MKYILLVIIFITSFATIGLFAQIHIVQADNGTSTSSLGLIPCNGDESTTDATATYKPVPCNFNQAIALINNLVQFAFVVVIIPVAIFVAIYAGWLFLTGGSNPSSRTKAKKMLLNVVIGFIIALAGFLIVKTILHILGYNPPAGLNFLQLPTSN